MAELTGPIYPWNLLLGPAHSIVDRVQSDWQKLLDDDDRVEADYHSFLAKYAGFFFSSLDTSVVISKLKLGSRETDFVNATDGASLGFRYELIELESPHTPSITKGDDYSARLTHAVKQVQDWQTWLNNHHSDAKEFFPSKNFLQYGEPNFTFTIYIGKRESEEKHSQLRNRYSRSLGIQVRSFDALTDNLRRKRFSPVPIPISTEWHHLAPEGKNFLANPFFEAYTHAEWIKLIKDPAWHPFDHMFVNNVKVLSKYRRYNHYLAEFVRIWEALPPNDKEKYEKYMGWIERA